MKVTHFLAILVVLLAVTVVPSAAAPLASPCGSGSSYDPACDVDHDGDIDIFDIQLTASHWGQAGFYNLFPAMVPQTGQTVSYAAGDDGDLEKGVPWPNPRFTNNFDGTVTDHLTGLVWLQQSNCDGAKDWAGALTLANALFDGYTGAGGGDCGLADGSVAGDWRLPNVRELYTLIDVRRATPALPQPNPFTDVVVDGQYWSSTTTVNAASAWIVSLDDGANGINAKSNLNFVWLVRDLP